MTNDTSVIQKRGRRDAQAAAHFWKARRSGNSAETDCDRCLPASRKEVIQPQVPLRLPCYDFTPVADLTVVGYLPCGLAHRLRVKPTPMV